jgi:multimeric flavodoxin WrbA
MKVLAINGSPRRNGNTATMLKSAIEGAASQGAKTELIHIYDLSFKGCISCLACKDKNGKSFSKCVQRDELTPVLEKILNIDVLLLGSPIYFTSMSAGMRAFYERAAYPFLPYNAETSSLFPKKINVGLILTIGADNKLIQEMGMDRHFEITKYMMGFIFGASELLIATNTNLSKTASNTESTEIIKHNDELFTANCKKAFEMGGQLLKKI